ncbi:MAG TPA: hypothetical protein VME17_09775 [Bryobacteraceae bacterium]|nr:hypothetical protein [Bryobacteraceae bacterium]
MAITNKYTLICDDVRQENNGKSILIGLYMGTITVPHVPFVLPSLSFFQVFESDRPSNVMFRIRLERMDTGHAIAEGMGMLNIQRPGLGIAVVKFAPIQMPDFGTYSLVVNIEGEQPIITTFNVEQQQQQQFAQPPQQGMRP